MPELLQRTNMYSGYVIDQCLVSARVRGKLRGSVDRATPHSITSREGLAGNRASKACLRLLTDENRRTAQYWQNKIGDLDYEEEEDKLDTPRFNRGLWKGR